MVGTGSGTISALHSFQLRYYIFNFHSLYQTADALKISIASPPKEYLVNHIVFQVAIHFPRHVDRDDLARAGALGLGEAAKRFDDAKGVPFQRQFAIWAFSAT